MIGGVSRAATEHHQLCVGDMDKMHTDARGLMDAGLDLAEAAWNDDDFDWSDCQRFIIHQVSRVHTSALCERLGDRPEAGAAVVPVLRQHRPGLGPVHPRARGRQPPAWRPGAVHGDRLRVEHRLLRNPLVTGATLPPSDLPGLDPTWSKIVSAKDATGRRRELARARRRSGRPRSAPSSACTATRPGRTPSGRSSPPWSHDLARHRARPARDGVLRAHRRHPPARRPHRRARRRSPTCSTSRGRCWSSPTTGAAPSPSAGPSVTARAVAGIVLLNTAVSQPGDAPFRRSSRRPQRLAAPHRDAAHPRLSRGHAATGAPRAAARRGGRLPLRRTAVPSRRGGIADFVADIPLERRPSEQIEAGRGRRRPRAALATCPPCCSGARETRSSPTGICATCSTGSRRRRRTVRRRRSPASSRTAPWLDVVAEFAADLVAGRARDLKSHRRCFAASATGRRTAVVGAGVTRRRHRGGRRRDGTP